MTLTCDPPTGASAPRRATSAPDFLAMIAQLKAAGVPLLGVSVTPSCRTLGAKAGKPAIGFTPRLQVELALSAAGIDAGYLPGVRGEADAFRRAVAAVTHDQAFIQAGYQVVTRYQHDDENEIVVPIMAESAKNVAARYLEQASVQMVSFNKTTKEISTTKAAPPQRRHVITSPFGNTAEIQPELSWYYERFQDCVTTNDISKLLASLLCGYCRGVTLRKGGGQYFVPRIGDSPELNPPLAKVSAFAERLQGLGQVEIIWLPIPIIDFDQARAGLERHARRDLAARGRGTLDRVDALIESLKETTKPARHGTYTHELDTIRETLDRARLFEDIFGFKHSELRHEMTHAENTLKALLAGRPVPPRPDPTRISEILHGEHADVLGELDLGDLGLDDLPPLEL